VERLAGEEVGGDVEGDIIVLAFQRGLCRHSGGVGWDLRENEVLRSMSCHIPQLKGADYDCAQIIR